MVILIIGPALLFGFQGKPTEMGLAIVAGAVASAFLNMDKLQRFKGAGFEAEMKAEVKQVVDKVHATLDNLRDVTRPLLISTLETLINQGRFGSINANTKHQLLADVLKTADSLQICSEEPLIELKERFYRYHTWDHYSLFVNNIDIINKDAEHKLKDFIHRDTYKYSNFPTRELISNILGEELVKLDDKSKNHLEDYLYYLNNHSLRRKDALEDN